MDIKQKYQARYPARVLSAAGGIAIVRATIRGALPAGFSGAFQGAPCGLRGRCGGPERDPPGRPLFFDPSRPLRAAILSSGTWRSEEHTSELQSLMRISYAVFCLKKKKTTLT